MDDERLWREIRRTRLSEIEWSLFVSLLNNIEIFNGRYFIQNRTWDKAKHADARKEAPPEKGWYTGADLGFRTGVANTNILTYAKTLAKRGLIERVPKKYLGSKKRYRELHFYRVKESKEAFVKVWKTVIYEKMEPLLLSSDYYARMMENESCRSLMISFAKTVNPRYKYDAEFPEEVNLYVLMSPQAFADYLDGKEIQNFLNAAKNIIPKGVERSNFILAMNAFQTYVRVSAEYEAAKAARNLSMMIKKSPPIYQMAFMTAYAEFKLSIQQQEKHTRGDKHRGHPKTPVTHT